MKTILLFSFLLLFSQFTYAQAPIIEWQKTIGGSEAEVLYSMQQTADGGYILGGQSTSGISSDKTEANMGGWDYWIVKLDANGNIVWQNTIGGSGDDYIRSIQQTVDGGYNAIYFVDNKNGWAVGDSGIIIHTTDGQNWTAQTNLSTNTLFDVFFLNALEGWAVGSGGSIIYTNNGGVIWSIVGTGLTSNSLTSLNFTSPTNGYVVGNGKTLIKYGMPLATEDENAFPRSFELKQNYPNPFNPITTIHYTLPEESEVTISINNLLGKQVRQFTMSNQPLGIHSIQWNGTDKQGNQVPAGIYFYQLKAGDFSDTKRLLLIK